MNFWVQRLTTASAAKSIPDRSTPPFILTAAGTAATAIAIGSIAWYYHLFGQDVYAMTPQDEGYVIIEGVYFLLSGVSL